MLLGDVIKQHKVEEELESLKAQLAEANALNLKLASNGMAVPNKLDESIKQNHVMRDALKLYMEAVERVAFSIPAPNPYTPQFIQLVTDAQFALTVFQKADQ